LNIVFEAYRQAIVKINKKVKYPPSKGSFCAFADISTATYNNYLRSPDESIQEVILRINDYLVDNMLTSAQVGDIKEITSIYRSKAEFGMAEAVAPQEIVHKTEVDTDKIKQMIEKWNNGESLKTIELNKKDYNVEGE